MILLYSVNQQQIHLYAPLPLIYELPELLSTIDQAKLCYQRDTILFFTFTKWRTTPSQHPAQMPTSPSTAPIVDWHTYTPNITHRPGTTPPSLQNYIDRFRQHACLHFMSHATRHLLAPNKLHIFDHDITLILTKYNQPLILTIDGSFIPSPNPHIYPPYQHHHPTTAYAAASVTITAINNSNPSRNWMNLPTIPILSRVQPLPAAYDTSNVTNNTAEILARILACELVPPHTPTIIIYDSVVVHSQHMSLVGNTSTNRQLIQTVFPAISRILTQRLEA